jgi:hypothetical protein
MSQSRDPRLQPKPGDVVRDKDGFVCVFHGMDEGFATYTVVPNCGHRSFTTTVPWGYWNELVAGGEVLYATQD